MDDLGTEFRLVVGEFVWQAQHAKGKVWTSLVLVPLCCALVCSPVLLPLGVEVAALSVFLPLALIMGYIEHHLDALWLVVVLFMNIGGIGDLTSDLVLLVKAVLEYYGISFSLVADSSEQQEYRLVLLRVIITLGGGIVSIVIFGSLVVTLSSLLKVAKAKRAAEARKRALAAKKQQQPKQQQPKQQASPSPAAATGAPVASASAPTQPAQAAKAAPTSAAAKAPAKPAEKKSSWTDTLLSWFSGCFGLLGLLFLWKVLMIITRLAIMYFLLLSFFRKPRFTIPPAVKTGIAKFELLLLGDLLTSGIPLGILTVFELTTYESLPIDAAHIWEFFKLAALSIDIVGACFLIYVQIFGCCASSHHQHDGGHHAAAAGHAATHKAPSARAAAADDESGPLLVGHTSVVSINDNAESLVGEGDSIV